MSWLLRAFLGTIEERRFRELSGMLTATMGDAEDDMRAVRRLWSPRIGKRLAAMEYQDFLKTYYWRSIRRYLLHTRGERCENCKTVYSRRYLHIHHKTYRNHGSEHLHLGDLMVLDVHCHEGVHSRD